MLDNRLPTTSAGRFPACSGMAAAGQKASLESEASFSIVPGPVGAVSMKGQNVMLASEKVGCSCAQSADVDSTKLPKPMNAIPLCWTTNTPPIACAGGRTYAHTFRVPFSGNMFPEASYDFMLQQRSTYQLDPRIHRTAGCLPDLNFTRPTRRPKPKGIKPHTYQFSSEHTLQSSRRSQDLPNPDRSHQAYGQASCGVSLLLAPGPTTMLLDGLM